MRKVLKDIPRTLGKASFAACVAFTVGAGWYHVQPFLDHLKRLQENPVAERLLEAQEDLLTGLKAGDKIATWIGDSKKVCMVYLRYEQDEFTGEIAVHAVIPLLEKPLRTFTLVGEPAEHLMKGCPADSLGFIRG